MSDAEAIASQRERWLAAFHEGDVSEMSKFVTEDHLVMAPNRPQVSGLAAAQDFWREGLSAASTTMSTDSHELTIANDMAVDRFNWKQIITPHDGEEALEDEGACIWIWRRGDDGAWRMAEAIWNSDLAEPGIWSQA